MNIVFYVIVFLLHVKEFQLCFSDNIVDFLISEKVCRTLIFSALLPTIAAYCHTTGKSVTGLDDLAAA